MDISERQIALSVLEGLRGDLMYAHMNSGSRVLDAADLRQYINALAMDGPYGNDNGHGQDIGKSNSHNGKAHASGKIWPERFEED
jgi:hypothetical protein